MVTESAKLGGRRTHFETVKVGEVPHGRKGKHDAMMGEILHDLQKLAPGSAMKVSLDAFEGRKLANIRAALNRATRQIGITVSTSTDDEFLYIWSAAECDVVKKDGKKKGLASRKKPNQTR